jgi:adenylate cyclase
MEVICYIRVIPLGSTMRASAATAYGPTHDEVRAALTRILADRNFIRSERMRRFLLLTVERTLEGGAQEISEYVLGREVFDRNKNYDPRIDSIVRVEARRLRSKLAEYYRKAGANDPVRIEYHPGSYVPVFRYSTTFLQTPAGLNPRTVAVLPFVSIGGDAGQEFFCDGMTEDILNALAAIPNLSIVARTSVFHFKGVQLDVRDIGARLGAGTVVEGSVRKSGDDLRISVKVINAATGLMLWSGNFDRQLTDVFILQNEIAQAIAGALRVTLQPAHPRNSNLDAYMFYLKGRYYWNQMSQAGMQTALESFANSIAVYPDYAPSHAALADAYGHLTVWGAIPPLEGAARARREALEALRLDETLADAHATLGGIVSIFDWNWEEGEQLLRRAIELQPSNVHALELDSLQRLYRGRFAEARSAIDQALVLDPLSSRGRRIKAWQSYYRRHYEEAIAILTEEIPLDATSHEGQVMLAWNSIRLGRFEEAIAKAQGLPEGPFLSVKLGVLGEAYAGAGEVARAESIVKELDELARSGYVSLRSRVYVHCGLGEWERVLPDLERCYEDHSPWLATLKVDPRFDPLREEERFIELLRSMGLG